jgi:hypothetical protein
MLNLSRNIEQLVRGVKNGSSSSSFFREHDGSASLLIKQKMFSYLMDKKMEKNRLNVYFQFELGGKTTDCHDSTPPEQKLIILYFNYSLSLGVKRRKSEMFAYDLVNCITLGGNQHVKQFWNFYHGERSLSFLKFRDFKLKCPNITVSTAEMKLPKRTTIFKPGVLISMHSGQSLPFHVRRLLRNHDIKINLSIKGHVAKLL